MKSLLAIPALLFAFASVLTATGYPPNVADDVWVMGKGIEANGIPTANYNNDDGPDLFDAYNALVGTSYDSNQALDKHLLDPRAVWSSDCGKPMVALVGLSAGYRNTLGIYSDLATGGGKTIVLGPESGFGFKSPYLGAELDVTGEFGFFLHANQAEYYYSDVALNTDGWERTMVFDLSVLAGTTLWIDLDGALTEHTLRNPYLVGWEDLPFANGLLGDEDYDDMIYLVDLGKCTQVPDAGSSVVLLGAALVGLMGLRRSIGRR